MAIKVKDLAVSGVKWGERAAGASGEYATNAAAAESEWGRATQAAESNYRAGISQANIGTRFARGVAKALSAGRFSKKINAVGASRFSAGVTGATDDWATGFGPYHAALQAVALPPRRPRGDAANIARVSAVTTTLHAKRLALLGA